MRIYFYLLISDIFDDYSVVHGNVNNNLIPVIIRSQLPVYKINTSYLETKFGE